jgi:hypothetical protein
VQHEYVRLVEAYRENGRNKQRTVRVVDLRMEGEKTKRCVTRGTARAAQILAALGIKDLDPPGPEEEGRTR